jgi:hypothetical protein
MKIKRYEETIKELASDPATYRGRWGHLLKMDPDPDRIMGCQDPSVAALYRVISRSTLQSIRTILGEYTGCRWPALKNGQDPSKVRDSKERDRRAWSMADTFTRYLADLFRYRTKEHSPDGKRYLFVEFPPVDEIRDVMYAIVRSARAAGALTQGGASHVEETIRVGCRLLMEHSRVFVRYVDGRRTHAWEETKSALAALGFDPLGSVDMDRYAPARHEWEGIPGFPADSNAWDYVCEKDRGADGQDWRLRPWVPVREPVSSLDSERLRAVWYVCCAIAGKTPGYGGMPWNYGGPAT